MPIRFFFHFIELVPGVVWTTYFIEKNQGCVTCVIRVHYIRIRIQHLQKVLDPDREVQNVIFSNKKYFKSSLIFHLCIS
jgi:hypothetical protein